MDMYQYIDYQIANIYMGEGDWPGNNIRFWRSHSQVQPKWRWIMFDRDQTFRQFRVERDHLAMATAANDPGWPNPPWSTELFRHLLTSDDFQSRFIQVYAYHINTTFDPQRIKALADVFQDRIAPEIPRHITRWGGLIDPDMNESWTPPPTFNSVGEWEQNVNEIRRYAEERPALARMHIQNKFGLSGVAWLNIAKSQTDAGRVKLYHKSLLADTYQGLHFKGVPVQLTAYSNPGYQFSHWTLRVADSEETLTSQQIEFSMERDMVATAHFTAVQLVPSSHILISEINYQSSPEADAGDWVELYNSTDEIIDLSGWYLKDGKDDNIF